MKIQKNNRLNQLFDKQPTDTEQEELTKEYEIIKYALTYLLSNLDDDVVEDMSDFVGTNNADEIESILQKAIDEY
jgi:hypothetical protein